MFTRYLKAFERNVSGIFAAAVFGFGVPFGFFGGPACSALLGKVVCAEIRTLG